LISLKFGTNSAHFGGAVLVHDHHICTSGNAEQPAFDDHARRAITTNQPHAPPR
jgi:thiamine biosynthesis lipoprotein ApbE